MRLTMDADELLAAYVAAIACVTAAYDDIDIDPAEAISDTDPLGVIFALSHQNKALLNLLPPGKAREIIEGWGAVATSTVADRAARGGAPRTVDGNGTD